MKAELISQYRSSLKMLMDTIEKCPDSLWDDVAYENIYWRIVYHALFYTSLYLSGSEDKFVPFLKHYTNINFLGAVTFDNKPIVANEIFTKAEMLEYAGSISNNLDIMITDEGNEDKCGFFWLPLNKLELSLYTLRHLQHHVGQLVERLHQNGISGISWVR
jgi:hypothetical protein